jgi:hypothetical protein
MNEGNNPLMVSRRRFVEASLMPLLAVGFIDALSSAELVPPAVKPIVARWLRDLHRLCSDLRGAAIPETVWQQQVAALLSDVPLEAFLGLIDFEQLIARTVLPDDRATTRDPVFPPLDGVPEAPRYIRHVFVLGQDRAIVPHGHQNMVSGHLVIHGSLRVRHFERVRDEPTHMVLRPTIDRDSRPGSATTVSDHRDNVHWLVATSKVAATFDVIVPDLDSSRPTRFTDFVDPRRGEDIGRGLLRAPRLAADDVFRLYGKSGV